MDEGQTLSLRPSRGRETRYILGEFQPATHVPSHLSALPTFLAAAATYHREVGRALLTNTNKLRYDTGRTIIHRRLPYHIHTFNNAGRHDKPEASLFFFSRLNAGVPTNSPPMLHYEASGLSLGLPFKRYGNEWTAVGWLLLLRGLGRIHISHNWPVRTRIPHLMLPFGGVLSYPFENLDCSVSDLPVPANVE